MVVQIFKLFDVYIHQTIPTAFVWLNLYMWLMKTCKLKPTATGFTRLFRCHFQPKMVFVKPSEEATASEAEPLFSVYTFTFHTSVLSPVVAYGNRWGGVDLDVVLLQGPPQRSHAIAPSSGERV